MKTLFADTFYFLALVNPEDAGHRKAQDINVTSGWRMITTAWVLTEVGDALAKPSNRGLFLRLLDRLQSSPNVQIVPFSMEVFHQGLGLFRARDDKEWTLTDCISFVIMQQHRVSEALTGDHHFEQAGYVALLRP